MDSSPSAYSSVISPQSRRLRIIGVLLIVAILIMALYGYFSLMPALARSAHQATANVPKHISFGVSQADVEHARLRAVRVRKLSVAIALAYWGVSALLVLGVLVVAWLDLREINRRYLQSRRTIWSETADRLDPSEKQL